MGTHKVPVDSDVEESYLHAAPTPDEIRQLVPCDSLMTAPLPEIGNIIAHIENQYLRFACQRIWSILVYLTYANFQKVIKNVKGSQWQERKKIKQKLLGKPIELSNIYNRGQHWNELVAYSDCGILLLVKQSFLPLLPTHKNLIAKQYLGSICEKEQLRGVVCKILSAFSPGDRVSISYYNNAYKTIRKLTQESTSAQNTILQSALVLQDLWTNPGQHRKIEFFVNAICARRTVFTYEDSNSYTMLVSDRCEGVREMRNALCCAYLKVCVPAESQMFSMHEWKHFGAAIKFLSENLKKSTHVESILKIVWLLVHYQVVSDDSSDNKWSTHSRLLGILQSKGIVINYKWSLFPAYESIVKFTGVRNKGIANDGINVREFEQCSHPPPCCDSNCQQEYSMIRDLGCSIELLVAIGLINDIEVKTSDLVNQRVRHGHALMEKIKGIKQWTKEPVGKNADVAMKIAHSFHLTAQMSVMVHLLGYTTKHPQLRMLGDELALLVLEIPDGSENYELDFYTMQHPLQPHFWAIFCSPKYDIQCLDRLKGIYDRSTKTNTGLPIVVVEHILHWQGKSQQNNFEHGWLWRMKQEINLEHDLSLG